MPPRKQQFSGKQKKAQLQAKRNRKTPEAYDKKFDIDLDDGVKKAAPASSKEGHDVETAAMHAQPEGTAHERLNRYALVFGKESQEEVNENKRKSREPLAEVNYSLLTSSLEDYQVEENELGMPKRGKWDYTMSKDKLEQKEQNEFNDWVSQLDNYYATVVGKPSYFERNIETWRQLWRTLENSDIILFICDIRYPTLHFSSAVYHYITKELGKQVVLVLNKVDMVPPAVSVTWKRYFEEKFPASLMVVLFSAFPDKQKITEHESKGLLKRRTIRKVSWALGADHLIQLAKAHYEDTTTEKTPGEPGQDFITIGTIGQPNAGKSSLINGILQDKKVSVSRTPGHTKHFQTIFYTDNIRLCDCPGLVFPTRAPKQLQVVSGMYPVSQVKEPYSIVGYIAERVPLLDILRIVHPCQEDLEHPDDPLPPWSAWYVCHAWAEKCGFLTARAGRADVYRAANSILRLTVEGRICLTLRPPDMQEGDIVGNYRDLFDTLMKFAVKEDNDLDEEDDLGETQSESEGEVEGSTVQQMSSKQNIFNVLRVDD